MFLLFSHLFVSKNLNLENKFGNFNTTTITPPPPPHPYSSVYSTREYDCFSVICFILLYLVSCWLCAENRCMIACGYLFRSDPNFLGYEPVDRANALKCLKKEKERRKR